MEGRWARGRDKEGRKEAHRVKGETFIITIVSSSLIPPIADCSNDLSFQHTWALPPSPPPSANLSLANPSLPPHNSFAALLFPPSFSMGSHCVWRMRERGREWVREGERQASGCKGECTWMGRLPGHAVRDYCPACQQPLSFNGARISSFWLWQMTGTWGRRGGDGRSRRHIRVCGRARKRNKECTGEGGGMKARFGDRGLKTKGPPNPPSTEILALNPSYGIVCCHGDFFPSFCGRHSF